MNILTLILALLRIAPMILEMIRDGRIKEATKTEVLAALEEEFNERWQARVDAAVAAGDRVHDVTLEGNDQPDLFDRAKNRK